jgi:NAD(P)-dependent dehydrogenase (short-subunit alcohol dehydrogenase family)
MTYRITGFSPPHGIEMAGDGASFRATDRIRIRPGADGASRVEYDLAIRGGPPPGGIGARLLCRWLEGNADAALARLREAFRSPGPVPVIRASTRMADRLVLPGLLAFTRMGYHYRRKRWRPLAADLGGRTAVVTGATSGIGRAAAYRLARLGAKVTLVARNPEAARRTASAIRRHTGNPSVGWELADLGEMEQVRRLADRLAATGNAPHILIHNAGALLREKAVTREGNDASLAVNLLAPFLLTQQLLPALEAGAPARVVTVSSGGMYLQRMDLSLLDPPAAAYDGVRAYALAKRGQVILTDRWRRKWTRGKVAAHVMHPGWVDTPGIARSLPGFRSMVRRMLRTPDQGADTVVWLAAAREAEVDAGGIWLDRIPHPVHISERTRETDSEKEALWEYLRHKTGWTSR